MTDPDLAFKKLALIETCVEELRTLSRPDQIPHDIREERFVEHTLQMAIQAALDVASHIVSDERLGEPRTNCELFDLLERAGFVTPDLAESLRKMAGFRMITARIVRPGEASASEEDWLDCSVEERLEAVWTLTKICHAWTGSAGEPRLQRSISRVQRPKGFPSKKSSQS
ncbi:MAG: HepT-like ribonuclease domain-containing protein [Acidobacteriota bacterium]